MNCKKAQIRNTGRSSCRAVALAIAIAACLPTYGVATESDISSEAIVNFSIREGDLSDALEKFSTQAGIQAMYRQDLVAGKRAREVEGTFAPSVALSIILEGTGLVWERVNDKTYVLKQSTRQQKNGRLRRPVPIEDESPSARRQDAADLEKVTVVGSRLAVLSPLETALPIKIITRQDIDRTGASSIGQVLSYLPESSQNHVGDTTIGSVGGDLGSSAINSTTVQLRGLPLGTTLVLINGRRTGGSSVFTDGQFDLSTIPLAFVERIEVLPAGASAVYGGDGLAGVVNIVLRRDVSGLEIRARRSAADGYGESQAGFTYGKSWSRGRLSASANWRKTGELLSSERSIVADRDYTRFGGPDRRNAFSNPANIYSLDGCPPAPSQCYVPIAQRGNLPGLDSPVASVPRGQDGRNLTQDDFRDTSGMLNMASEEYLISSPESSYSLGLDGVFELLPRLELFTEWAIGRRSISAVELPITLSGGQNAIRGSIVPASNPLNPFGVDIGVTYRLEETGVYREYSQDYWRGLIGARGQWGRWDWEMAAWHSRDSADTGGIGYFSGSNDTWIPLLATSDPAVGFNPFVGDGTSPASDEVINSLFSQVSDDFRSALSGFNGYIRGPLVDLPAGAVVGLLGTEYQKSTIKYQSRSPGERADGGDIGRAIFGELRVPVMKGREEGPAWERIVLTGAVRHESNGRFEQNALTKGIGLEYRPVRSLLFRANYSTAFKPISIHGAVRDQQMYQSAIFNPDGSYILIDAIYFGGIPPELKPETSTSKTLGLVYAPTNNFGASFTHWSNRLQDRYFQTQVPTIVENEEHFPGRVVRDPDSGQIILVDIRPVNLSLTEMSGVDMNIDTAWSTRYGDWDASIGSSYTYKYDEQLTPEAEVTNNLAVRRQFGWSPRWKVVPRIGWSYSDTVYATLMGRFIGSYEDPAPFPGGPNAGTVQKLGDFWLFDLNINLNLERLFAKTPGAISDARLVLGATNLFNRLPDYCNSCATMAGGRGYDPSQYDIFGRQVYAEIKLSF